MTITNKHLGWAIIVLLISIPWYPPLFTDQCWLCRDEYENYGWWQLMRFTEVILIGIAVLVAVCFTAYGLIGELLSDYSDFAFKYEIKLPKFKFSNSDKEVRENLIRFGQLKKDDLEYDKLYIWLKSKGVFG